MTSSLVSLRNDWHPNIPYTPGYAVSVAAAVLFSHGSGVKAHVLAEGEELNMDDAGDIAPAAAMGMMIFYTNVIAKLMHAGLAHRILARTQAWR